MIFLHLSFISHFFLSYLPPPIPFSLRLNKIAFHTARGRSAIVPTPNTGARVFHPPFPRPLYRWPPKGFPCPRTTRPLYQIFDPTTLFYIPLKNSLFLFFPPPPRPLRRAPAVSHSRAPVALVSSISVFLLLSAPERASDQWLPAWHSTRVIDSHCGSHLVFGLGSPINDKCPTVFRHVATPRWQRGKEVDQGTERVKGKATGIREETIPHVSSTPLLESSSSGIPRL